MKMRLLLPTLLLLLAGQARAQVTVGPNTIHGTFGFTNTSSAVTSLLSSVGLNSSNATQAVGTPTDMNGGSASSYDPVTSPYGGTYSLAAQGASTGAGYDVSITTYYFNAFPYSFKSQSTSLQMVATQPSGVTLNFQEEVTIHRIRFGTDSTCNTPVAIGGGNIYPLSPPYGSLQGGTSPSYFFTPNNRGAANYHADIQVQFGTNTAVDTFVYDFPNVDLSAAGDTVVEHCLVLPTGGSGSALLGNIVTPVSVAGHTVNFVRASGAGPNGNSRNGYTTGAAPSSFSLINLVPGSWDMLYPQMNIDSGDAYTAMQLPGVQSLGITAGVTIDASSVISGITRWPFTFTPGNLTGTIRVLDQYAAAHPGTFSTLSVLNFDSAFASLSPQGWGTGTYEDNHRNEFDSASTWSRSSFSGRYNPAIAELDSPYTLPFAMLYDQPIQVAPRPDLNLVFSSAGPHNNPSSTGAVDPTTFRYGVLSLSSEDGDPATLSPGQSLIKDWEICVSDVTVLMQSTTLPFVNPTLHGTTPAHTINDLSGNPLGFSGNISAIGTPAAFTNAPAANSGSIVFPLTPGTWTLTPSGTFVDSSGHTSNASFSPITVTVSDCGQRLTLVPGLSVTIDPPAACVPAQVNGSLVVPFAGALTATNATVDHAWYTINGGSPIDLCSGNCTSAYSTTAMLSTGANNIVVYASSGAVNGTPSVAESISCNAIGCGTTCSGDSQGGSGGGTAGGSGGGSAGGGGSGGGTGGGSCQSISAASGQVLFEDLWPENGDLDFNDQNFGFQYTMVHDLAGNLVRLKATFNAFSLGASINNGLYLHLPGVPASSIASVVTRYYSDATTSTTSSISGETDAVIEISPDTRQLFNNAGGYLDTLAGSMSIVSKDVAVVITFTTPVTPSQLDTGTAPFDLFIARTGDYGHQIHLSQYPGTTLMNTTLFGTGDDNSYRTGHGTAGVYFVNNLGLPFAISVPDWIDWPIEKTDIGLMYPSITSFASQGTVESNASGWYTAPVNSYGYAGGAIPTHFIHAGPLLRADTSGCGDGTKKSILEACGRDGMQSCK